MTILSIFFVLQLSGQDHASVMNAIGSGDANQVAQYMDQNIELCFDDKVEFLSKPQAKKALAAFYQENQPMSFNTLHKGNSKGKDSKYLIGEYKADNGNKFRVYIFAKEHGSSSLIQEIRFDVQK